MLGPGPNRNGGLCECGCGERAPLATQSHTRHGYIKDRPMRFVKGHNNRGRPMKETHWREEDRGFATPCWVWNGVILATGYGAVKRYGKTRNAHRFTYEQHRGPVPEGLQLDHLCRVRACVNPDHLEAVTPMVNVNRSTARKLRLEQTLAIISAPTAVEAGRICESFGLSNTYGRALHSGRERPLYLTAA